MTDLEQAIHAIEHGLLPLTRGGEPPAEKIELSQRMQHYQVPGFSVAFVQNDEVAWASGFGVVQAAR
jgi:CubicO group peptidase (beta-lactamase class C family)